MLLCKFHGYLLLETFPQHKARDEIGKMDITTRLSADTVYRFIT